jgi:hypothetical protein
MSEEAGESQGSRDALFARFSEETDPQCILKTFGELCNEICLDPAQYEGFFQALKDSFTSWKASAMFQLLQGRAKHPDYHSADGSKSCAGKRVLVIGAGPVGLRAAIEAAFLGAKVDVVEKRTSFTRNNSLHLWPFLITDLKNLGAKKFYGRFCSSTIDHICEYFKDGRGWRGPGSRRVGWIYLSWESGVDLFIPGTGVLWY